MRKHHFSNGSRFVAGSTRPRFSHSRTSLLRAFFLCASLLCAFLRPGGARAAESVILPGPLVFPESVTSVSDGTIFAGSLASGGIFRAKPGAAQAELWIKPGAFGTRSIFGVFADEKAGLLWACSNDLSARGIATPGDATGSWIKGFDLHTGLGLISARFPGDGNLCNDSTVGPDGALYVTNSTKPQILRLDPVTRKLTIWLTSPLFTPPKTGAGLDGIAFGADGNLYVDTFNTATLLRVVMKDGRPLRVERLHPSRPLVLADALRRTSGGNFLLVEGGGRLDRLTIDGDDVQITTLRDALLNPTGVTETNGAAWVSEGQLPRLFGQSPPNPVLPFRLVAVPLATPQTP